MILKAIDGTEFIVDDNLSEEINEAKWSVVCRSRNSKGYISSRQKICGEWKTVSLHRLLAGATAGECVDHINGNTFDNRIENLRVCSHRENMRNIRKKAAATSKYKGVFFISSGGKRRKRWASAIMKDYKKISIGYFATEREAALAYNKKATELFGEFAKLNEVA